MRRKYVTKCKLYDCNFMDVCKPNNCRKHQDVLFCNKWRNTKIGNNNMKPMNQNDMHNMCLHSITVAGIIKTMNTQHLDEQGQPAWFNKQIAGNDKIEYPFTDILSTNATTGKEICINVTGKSPWYENFCIPVGKFDINEAMYIPNNILDFVDYFAFVSTTHVYFVSSKAIRNNFETFEMKEDASKDAKYILVPMDFINKNAVKRYQY